jgi:hypothetical protein
MSPAIPHLCTRTARLSSSCHRGNQDHKRAHILLVQHQPDAQADMPLSTYHQLPTHVCCVRVGTHTALTSKSSTINTLAPFFSKPSCNSMVSGPYSFMYVTFSTLPGNLPGFRSATNPTPSASAMMGPNRKPLRTRDVRRIAQSPLLSTSLQVQQQRRSAFRDNTSLLHRKPIALLWDRKAAAKCLEISLL